jgi:hypothetical protein
MLSDIGVKFVNKTIVKMTVININSLPCSISYKRKCNSMLLCQQIMAQNIWHVDFPVFTSQNVSGWSETFATESEINRDLVALQK